MKGKNNKRLNSILVASMIGIGSFSYIPIVHAEGTLQNDSTSVEENPQLSKLTKLEIEGTSLDQVFSEDVTTYTAMVENVVENIQLHLESTNPEAKIMVNGELVSDGITDPLLLHTGENIFTITVNNGTQTAASYQLTVTRKKNNNNLLKSINLSKGVLSPNFDSTVTDYDVKVANDVDSITVTPEAIEKTASISVNNSLFSDKGISVKIAQGKSDIEIIVTSENGEIKTYTLHVSRAALQNNKPPFIPTNTTKPGTNRGSNRSQSAVQQNNSPMQKTSTALLSSLTVSEGTWTSDFSKNNFTYHIAVPNNAATVTINPKAVYSSAAVLINGGTDRTIQLVGNKTVIPLQVTKGEDRKTYVLVFDKPVQQMVASSTESNLASATPNVSTTSNQDRPSMPTMKESTSKTTTSFWDKIIAFFKKIF